MLCLFCPFIVSIQLRHQMLWFAFLQHANIMGQLHQIGECFPLIKKTIKYVATLICSGAKLPSTAADQTLTSATDNSDPWYKVVLRKIHQSNWLNWSQNSFHLRECHILNFIQKIFTDTCNNLWLQIQGPGFDRVLEFFYKYLPQRHLNERTTSSGLND